MHKSTVITAALALTLSIGGLFAAGLNQRSGTVKTVHMDTVQTNHKMKVEIWSDVVCPFCYIGKTKFETALQQFADSNNVEIEWKSYQLMPELVTRTDRNIDQVLSETKGLSIDQARQMNAQAALMGKQAGLEYNFDKAVVANTFRAHQFLHFAKANGKQTEAEGLLFRAYFTEGRNVDDLTTLLDLGSSIGLDAASLKSALESETYAGDVKADINEAAHIGVRGVPFFVFNRKYAVSGAQEPSAYLEVLKRSFAEWRNDNPANGLSVQEGAVCRPGGDCK